MKDCDISELYLTQFIEGTAVCRRCVQFDHIIFYCLLSCLYLFVLYDDITKKLLLFSYFSFFL